MSDNEWLTEQNLKEFTYKGVNCLIVRNSIFKHLNGYIECQDDAMKEKLRDLTAHGSWTYEEKRNPTSNKKSSHVWIGFDCAHANDLLPGISELLNHEEFKNLSKELSRIELLLNSDAKNKTYRNMAYVEKTIKDLIDQVI